MTTVSALADDLATLAANLREAGDVGLRRELIAGIREGTKPVPEAIRKDLKPHLPDRYAEVLDADLRITISVHTGASDPGVFIIAQPIKKKRKIRTINAGNLRHPVFGSFLVPRRNWTWRDQEAPSVEPGWFDDPCKASAPGVREQIDAALDRVKAQIWAGVHG